MFLVVDLRQLGLEPGRQEAGELAIVIEAVLLTKLVNAILQPDGNRAVPRVELVGHGVDVVEAPEVEHLGQGGVPASEASAKDS